MLSNWRAPFPDKEASWQRIESKIDRFERGRRVRRVIAVAASVAVLLALSPLFFGGNGELESIAALSGEQKEIRLPEGSLISLNSESTVEYDLDDFTEERVLKMSGEAYFDVEPGSRFRVETDMGSVTVLGTEFNVYSRPDGFEVHCTEGRVEVSQNGQKEIIQAGEWVAAYEDGLSAAQPIIDDIAWMNSAFSFETAPLSRVIDEVERRFDVNIETKEDGKLFTGYFQAENADAALQIVTQSLGMELSKENGDFILRTR